MIQFVQPLEPERLRTAFNNDVVRFYTDLSTEPNHADVTLGTGPTIRLYPAPDGRFYFNFKPYITTLINTNNFEDTLQTELTVTDVTSFALPAPGIALRLDVTITISAAYDVTDTATHTLNWLAAAQQLGSYRAHKAENRSRRKCKAQRSARKAGTGRRCTQAEGSKSNAGRSNAAKTGTG